MLDRLKEIAPNVAFTVSREHDPDFQWDGDGPDPEDEGYEPQNVTVTASTIMGGELLEGNAYIGGSYDLPDNPCPDVHGYLPQMLEEAANDLHQDVLARLKPTHNRTDALIANQLVNVKHWLKAEMQRRYDEQMKAS